MLRRYRKCRAAWHGQEIRPYHVWRGGLKAGRRVGLRGLGSDRERAIQSRHGHAEERIGTKKREVITEADARRVEISIAGRSGGLRMA